MEDKLQNIENRMALKEEVNSRFDKIDNRFERMENRIDKLENDVSFLREEMRLGFNTLNTTLQAMFNITASSIRANKEVVSIMENAYSEAAEKYSEIKAK